jgi:hypothetical protein
MTVTVLMVAVFLVVYVISFPLFFWLFWKLLSRWFV